MRKDFGNWVLEMPANCTLCAEMACISDGHGLLCCEFCPNKCRDACTAWFVGDSYGECHYSTHHPDNWRIK